MISSNAMAMYNYGSTKEGCYQENGMLLTGYTHIRFVSSFKNQKKFGSWKKRVTLTTFKYFSV